MQAKSARGYAVMKGYVGDPVGTADVVKLDGWSHTGIPEHVRFVDEFPATLSGKIQKYKNREFEIEARCLQSIAKTSTPIKPNRFMLHWRWPQCG